MVLVLSPKQAPVSLFLGRGLALLPQLTLLFLYIIYKTNTVMLMILLCNHCRRFFTNDCRKG